MKENKISFLKYKKEVRIFFIILFLLFEVDIYNAVDNIFFFFFTDISLRYEI